MLSQITELVAISVKRRDGIISRRVDGELLLLDLEYDQIHQLNESATFIWDTWEQVSDEGDLAKLLAQKFHVKDDVALNDVVVMVGRLRELHLLVNSPLEG